MKSELQKGFVKVALVMIIPVAIVAQQNAAILYAKGDVTLNGVAVQHDSSVLVPGDKIATGAKTTTTMFVPGVPAGTVKLGTGSSLVYNGSKLQLNSGAVLVTSNGNTSVQLDSLTVSAPQSGEFLVTTTPGRNISCLKGNCNVSDGTRSVNLNTGQALLAKAQQSGSAGNNGEGQDAKQGGSGASPGATGGIPSWVIGVVSAAAAAGISIATTASHGEKPPSPSVP